MLGCSHNIPVLTPALENMVEHKLTSLASTAACIISVQPLNVACNKKVGKHEHNYRLAINI